MLDTMKEGTILIREGTALPAGLKFESETCSSGWRSVQGLDGSGLDRKVQDAGWHFLYFAGETKGNVLGASGPKSALRAIKKVLWELKSQKFNCLEITRVVPKRLLGLNYTTFCFHPRNIQEGMSLAGDEISPPWSDIRVSAA